MGALAQQFTGILILVAFRALPVVLHVCGSRRYGPRAKLASVLLLLLLTSSAGRMFWGTLLGICLGVAYFSVSTALMHWTSTWKATSKPASFLLACLLYMGIPSAIFPEFFAGAALVWGWEMMLSAYSYCVERSQGDARSVQDAWFFVLVDPVIVWSQRSIAIRVENWVPGLLRVGIGIGALLTHDLIRYGYVSAIWNTPSGFDSARPIASYLELLVYLAVRTAALYLAHSGLASVQIGMMRLSGFETIERYAFPMIASSPQEFWQRFNRWVGAWAKRYVYYPVALYLGRHVSWLDRQYSKALALLVTFGALGLMHDVPNWITSTGTATAVGSLAFTGLFLTMGLLFVAWVAVGHSRLIRPLRSRLNGPGGTVLRWVAFWNLFLVAAWLCEPYAPPDREGAATEPSAELKQASLRARTFAHDYRESQNAPRTE